MGSLVLPRSAFLRHRHTSQTLLQTPHVACVGDVPELQLTSRCFRCCNRRRCHCNSTSWPRLPRSATNCAWPGRWSHFADWTRFGGDGRAVGGECRLGPVARGRGDGRPHLCLDFAQAVNQPSVPWIEQLRELQQSHVAHRTTGCRRTSLHPAISKCATTLGTQGYITYVVCK